MSTLKLVTHMQIVGNETKKMLPYVGRILLLKAIFGSQGKGPSKPWEDSMDEALNTLTPREKEIIELRFGIRDGIPQTLQQVGRKFGLTRERIRQLEDKILRKLRHPARRKVLMGMSWQIAVQEFKVEGTEVIEKKRKEDIYNLKNDNGNLQLIASMENIPLRVINTLNKANYNYVHELVNATDKKLLKIRGIGNRSLYCIRNVWFN